MEFRLDDQGCFGATFNEANIAEATIIGSAAATDSLNRSTDAVIAVPNKRATGGRLESGGTKDTNFASQNFGAD